MDCQVFTYTRSTDPLLYECLDACDESYFSETNVVVRTVGEWTVVAISGTWFSTVDKIRDYLTFDALVAAEAIESVRNHRLYRSVREAILQVLRSNDNVKLVLTGHSAGGCIGALIATEVQSMCKACKCIAFNPFLNFTLANHVLDRADAEKLEVLWFFTVEDITVPMIRALIPRMESRAWIRWVVPNFRDAPLPLHMLNANFRGRDPIVAYSTLRACVLERVLRPTGGTTLELPRRPSGSLAIVVGGLATVAVLVLVGFGPKNLFRV